MWKRGVVLFLGQNKPLHRQGETKCNWMDFEGVIQNKKLVHMPSLLSLLLWSADSTVPASWSCGNVDHLPPVSSVCKADSSTSEQKTDIKLVILTYWAGREAFPVAEVHAGILFEVCIVFDRITESVHFCVVLFCLSFMKEWGGEMNLVQFKCPLSFSPGKDSSIVSLAQAFSFCNFLRDILSLIAWAD